MLRTEERKDVEISDPQYEVEIRCHFVDRREVYQRLPFFRESIYREGAWSTGIYGLSLFKSGELLRVGEVHVGGETRIFLRWKSRDIGTFANIRIEIGDEITNGISDSLVLRRLGGQSGFLTARQVIEELKRLGHHRFMTFEGHDWYGKYEPLDVEIKMMNCPVLKWPLLVEFEKIARTEKEARQFEKELYELSHQLGLENCLLREEPPSQLYAKVFGQEGLIQSTEAWNRVYKQHGTVVTEPHEDMPSIVQSLKDRGASTVLDLGSGTGRHVIYLARNGFSVFGLDNSPAGIELTCRWLTDEGLTADLRLQSMAEQLPYEDKFFDAIISVQVIHHADSATIREIVQELTRVLKGGGFLFVTVPKLKNQGEHFEQVEPNTFIPLDGPEKGLPHHYFSPEELREVFGDFDVADIHLDMVNHYCLSAVKL